MVKLLRDEDKYEFELKEATNLQQQPKNAAKTEQLLSQRLNTLLQELTHTRSTEKDGGEAGVTYDKNAYTVTVKSCRQ